MVWWFLASMLVASDPDCAAVGRSVGEPLAIRYRPISAQELSARVEGQAGRDGGLIRSVAVGRLDYQGYGISIRSDDARFADIMVDPQRGLLHRCGNGVFAPSGWNAFDARPAAWTIALSPPRADQTLRPGAEAAARRGASPMLEGHELVASWPIHKGGKRFFLGLMRPVSGALYSEIVAFGDAPGPVPALPVARLDRAFQAISVVPGLHTPEIFVNLAGRNADGDLDQVVLRASDERLAEIAADLDLGETPGT